MTRSELAYRYLAVHEFLDANLAPHAFCDGEDRVGLGGAVRVPFTKQGCAQRRKILHILSRENCYGREYAMFKGVGDFASRSHLAIGCHGTLRCLRHAVPIK